MTRKRGLALVDKDKRSMIASIGGQAAHALGKAHTWTKKEAKAAGRRGGKAERKVRPAPKYAKLTLEEKLRLLLEG